MQLPIILAFVSFAINMALVSTTVQRHRMPWVLIPMALVPHLLIAWLSSLTLATARIYMFLTLLGVPKYYNFYIRRK